MKLINDKRIFLIDSFIYIYKYYYYYKKYYNNKSIVFGFINFIINILILKKPTYIYIIFDGKINKSKKKQALYNYKLNRKKIPFNLKKNLLIIKKILCFLNIKYIKLKYIEADDIIGSIIKQTEKYGFINYIYTEDSDYYQLISNSTFLIIKNIIINKKYILDKFNINNINQYIDLISLIGDKTDNIPGIPYIGIKTASFLLKKYNDIKNIFLNINKLKKNIKKKIINYKISVYLSKKIIKINKNIHFNLNIIYPREKINNIKIIYLLNKIDDYFFIKKIKNIKKIIYL